MKKNAASDFLIRTESILGVDLGSNTVRLIELRVSGRKIAVLDYAQRSVWKVLAEAKTEEDKRQIYARVLQSLLSTHHFKARGAASALSGNLALVRYFKLPRGAKFDAKSDLPKEARALSPFEPQDSEIDFQPLAQPEGGDGRQGEPELRLLVAQKKAVAQHMEILAGARLRPVVVLNDVLALEKAYAFFHGGAQETIVLVDIGASTTSVHVLENGVSRAVRIFNIAGDAFTRALERGFSVPADEAERLKLEHGLSGHRRAGEGASEVRAGWESDASVRVYRALKPVAKDLSLGIRRTIDSFMEKRRENQAPVSKIVLAGGSAEMKLLPEVMSAETGIPAEVFRPLESAEQGPGAAALPAASAALAVALGLGLSHAPPKGAPHSGVNLLPKEAQRAAALRRIVTRFLLPAAVIGVLAGGARQAYIFQARLLAQRAQEAERLLKAAPAAKKKPAARKDDLPAKERRPVSRFAFLGRLKVSGFFGGKDGVTVMLSGGGSEYVAKGGRLIDENGAEIAGVSADVSGETLILRADSGEKYAVALPK